MKTPHKHAALIKQWADGATIQYKWPINNEWITFNQDALVGWHSDCEYRVKPEPKPDVIRYGIVEINPGTDRPMLHRHGRDNIMFVFDGETGKLKDAQVLVHE